MSTEPHPDVNVDESGIEPRQMQQHGPEWPKKIRTLTATELDRLTIDSSGRFYWDGKLVNYEPPTGAKPGGEKSEPRSRAADLLDDDPYSFDETKSSEHVESDEADRSDDASIHPVAHREDRFHDLDEVHAVPRRAAHHGMGAEMPDAYAEPSIQIPDRIRVSMTRWQSLGAIIVVLCLMVGALGLAAFGFIAVQDWGCRAGLIQSNCAAAPGGRPAMLSDIPA